MLLYQHKIKFSEYSSIYDLIVSKDNLLRKINNIIDFSIVYQELVDKYYSTKRPDGPKSNSDV